MMKNTLERVLEGVKKYTGKIKKPDYSNQFNKGYNIDPYSLVGDFYKMATKNENKSKLYDIGKVALAGLAIGAIAYAAQNSSPSSMILVLNNTKPEVVTYTAGVTLSPSGPDLMVPQYITETITRLGYDVVLSLTNGGKALGDVAATIANNSLTTIYKANKALYSLIEIIKSNGTELSAYLLELPKTITKTVMSYLQNEKIILNIGTIDLSKVANTTKYMISAIFDKLKLNLDYPIPLPSVETVTKTTTEVYNTTISKSISGAALLAPLGAKAGKKVKESLTKLKSRIKRQKDPYSLVGNFYETALKEL